MARSFNGSSDYAEVATSPVSGMPLTISAWFNTPLISAQGQIVSVNLGLEADFAMLIRSSGGIRARQTEASGAQDSSTSGSIVVVDTWNHGVAVFSSTTSRTVYLNNVAGTVGTVSVATSTPTKVLIGARYSAGVKAEFFNGKIAEVGIWNVALTAAEIAILSLGVSPLFIRPQNLVSYVPLIGRTSPEIDYKGTGLTLTGTATADHPRVYQAVPPLVLSYPAAPPPPPGGNLSGMFFAT